MQSISVLLLLKILSFKLEEILFYFSIVGFQEDVFYLTKSAFFVLGMGNVLYDNELNPEPGSEVQAVIAPF